MLIGWKIVLILYVIALIPSFIVTVIFIQNKMVPQLGKLLTFLSIWMVMPFYLVGKLFGLLKSRK